jgi:hypothetical protein
LEQPQANDSRDDCCQDDCCGLAGGDNSYRNVKQDVPSDKQCPPTCPANKKVDHSKLVEQHVSASAFSLTITPCDSLADVSLDQRLSVVVSPLQRSAPLIYLTFCTLLI